MINGIPIWAWIVIIIGALAFFAIVIATFMAPEGYEDETGYHDGTENKERND